MIFIGTSGYNYPHWWNGTFYPSDLPQKKWLEFYPERVCLCCEGKPVHHPHQAIKGLQGTAFPFLGPCLAIKREIGCGPLATSPAI